MVPSARATKTTSCSAAKPAMTCTTRGSLDLAKRSTRSSKATFWVLSRVAMGSTAGYKEREDATRVRAIFTRPCLPWLAMVRTVWAASSKALQDKSSE